MAEPTPEPAPAQTPTLLPCPFTGSTDLDDSGEVIKCNTSGAMGPVPGEGQDKYTAWNERAEDTLDEEPPSTDPAAEALELKTLADARAGYSLMAEVATRLHGKLAAAALGLRNMRSDCDKARAAYIELSKEKAAVEGQLASANKAHAEYKAEEPKRLNAEAQRLLEVSGTPAPVKTHVDTNASANPGKPKGFAHLKGLERAIAAHSASSSSTSN
jgi:hypothetical protein